jgi:hypothetical protein
MEKRLEMTTLLKSSVFVRSLVVVGYSRWRGWPFALVCEVKSSTQVRLMTAEYGLVPLYPAV